MKFIKSLFIAGSLLLFTSVMTSCEDEEIVVQHADGDSVPDIGNVEE